MNTAERRNRRPEDLPEILVTLSHKHPGFLRCTEAEAELIGAVLNSRVTRIDGNRLPLGNWTIRLALDLTIETKTGRPDVVELFRQTGRTLRDALPVLAAMNNPRPKRVSLFSRMARRLRPTRTRKDTQ